MEQQKLQTNFFFLILIVASLLAFLILRPYIFTVFLAITFAVIFSPVHKKITAWIGNRKALAAFLTTLLVFVAVLLPVTFIGFQIFQESRSIYTYLTASSNTNDFFYTTVQTLQERINAILPNAKLNVAQGAQQIAQWMVQHLGSIFSQLFELIVNFFLFLLSLYYLLKDGESFKRHIIKLSPLDNTYDQHIFDKLAQAINSVIGGSLIIALIQGTLTGLGFYITGIPNAVLWGTIAALAALIPSIGTALVLTPGIFYLFFIGSLVPAIGLTIWGILAVGLIDNLLGPKIIAHGSQIHSFAILLSVLGGIKYFGLIGFIIGPFILTLLFALLNIYSSLVQRKAIE
jgi:predicted PurR-regulated permease PerM